MVQSLRLAWLSRILSDTNDTWKAIPNYYFNKHGGLAFLLNCNYNASKLAKNLPLFYRELLEYLILVLLRQIVFKTLTVNSSCGTTKTLQSTAIQCFGNHGLIAVFSLSTISMFWIWKGIFSHLKNFRVNLKSKLIFCIFSIIISNSDWSEEASSWISISRYAPRLYCISHFKNLRRRELRSKETALQKLL